MIQTDASCTSSPVPLHLVCGFLGSGKTSLIKRILTSGEKLAVIQNEFTDEMGIELPTLLDEDGSPIEGLWELPSGCLCCTIKDSLATTLELILERQDPNDPFKRVLVECNGLSDPITIVHRFWLDDEQCSNFILKSTICVVDASTFHQYLHSNNSFQRDVFQRQIAAADVCIINKIDEAAKTSTKGNRIMSDNHDTMGKPIDEVIALNCRDNLSELNPIATSVFADPYCNVNLLKLFTIDRSSSPLPIVRAGHAHGHRHSEEKANFVLLKWTRCPLETPTMSNLRLSNFFEWIDKWLWRDEYQTTARALYTEDLVFDQGDRHFQTPHLDPHVDDLRRGETAIGAMMAKETKILRIKGLVRLVIDRPSLLSGERPDNLEESVVRWCSIQGVGPDVEVILESSLDGTRLSSEGNHTLEIPNENKLLIIALNCPSTEELQEGIIPQRSLR